MVEFLRDRPEYTGKTVKYIIRLPLFPDIADQSVITEFVSSGWGPGKEPEDKSETPPKSEFRHYYMYDGEVILVTKTLRATLKADGFDDIHLDLFDDDNKVFFNLTSAIDLGYDYPKNEDGTPVEGQMPMFYTADLQLDTVLVADHMEYTLEVIGDDDTPVQSDSGTIDIVDPPVE